MRSKNPIVFDTIEAFINSYREQYGIAPSMQQIADDVGMAKSTIHSYLACMKEDGRITYAGQRGYLTRENIKSLGKGIKTPIIGTIACGLPILAEENVEGYVTLPEALFGSGDFFILRAKGDSMIDGGIDDGDLVIIRQQSYADPGQIVVALIGEEATLKQYFLGDGCIRLHPKNSLMEDIFVKQCVIQGIAVKVLKDIL